MGQIYGNEAEKKEKPPALGGLSFGKAVMDAGCNVVSTFGVATLSIEDDEKTGSWRGALQAQFSPLSALAFMAFTLLYMPCVVTAAAFKHEWDRGAWEG
jgi:ferrous iron transport protein B